MQAIAAFVLRGRHQAILSIIGLAALELIFTRVGLFSAAAIGLVTLVQGQRQGLIVMLVATTFFLVIASISNQTATSIVFVLIYWLPTWFLAQLLARQISLQLVILSAGVIGLVASVITANLYITYEQQFNLFILDNFLPAFKGVNTGLSPDELKVFLISLGKQVATNCAAYWVLSMCINLFIARWWQAMIYHPGGFGEEFRSIRFGLIPAIGGMLIVMLTLSIGSGLLSQIFLSCLSVVILLFLMQGLSITHYVVKVRKLASVWLVVTYFLVILLPYQMFLIAIIGLSDNWVNYRKRVTPI